MAPAAGEIPTAPACDRCGMPFEYTPDGTGYHVSLDGSSDPSRDRDHAPYATGTLW